MYLRSTFQTSVALTLAFAVNTAFAHDPDDYGNYSPIFIPPPVEGAKGEGGVNSPLLFDVSATVGGGYGWGEHNRATGPASSNLDDTRWPFLNGDARISIPLTNQISTQLDFGGFAMLSDTGTDTTDQGEDQAQNYFYSGMHINHRNPEVGSVGLFGLLGKASGGEDESATLWTGGLEGERYFGNLTTYGQWGWLDSNDGSENDSLADAWLVRGGVRYYLNDFSRFVLDYQFAEGGEHNDSTGEIEAQTWGIRFERRGRHRPITWYIGYQETSVDNEDGSPDRVEVDYFVTGLSIGLGANNLKEQERRGAGGTMPNVGEWVAWSQESVD